MPVANAADWTLQGTASQSFDHDDNIGLNAFNVSSGSSVSTATLALRGRGSNFDVGLGGRFPFSRFFEEPTLNSNDQYLNFDAAYRLPRSDFRLLSAAAFDTTRTSELDDTGRFILDNAPHRLYTVNPSWTYRLSPISSLTSFLGFRAERFPTGVAVDNNSYSGGFGYARNVTRQLQFDGILSGQRFITGLQSSDVLSLQGGVSYLFGPTVNGRLVAGPRVARVTNKVTDAETTSIGTYAEGTLTWRPTPRWNLEGALLQGLDPSSSGQLLNRFQFGLRSSYELRRMVFFDVSAYYLNQESVQQVGGSDTREYIEAAPSLRWRITRDVDLRAQYRFRMQSFGGSDQSFDSNAVLLTLNVQTPTWFMSR